MTSKKMMNTQSTISTFLFRSALRCPEAWRRRGPGPQPKQCEGSGSVGSGGSGGGAETDQWNAFLRSRDRSPPITAHLAPSRDPPTSTAAQVPAPSRQTRNFTIREIR